MKSEDLGGPGAPGDAGVHRAYVQTVEALARMLEMRDRYTSLHQKRVASLASAIAEEMGLPARRVKGVRLGALIHDIGKIYVPMEILARPGQLLPAELELMRAHAQVGYDIVESVQFPWPVAEIILQHHERMDGSGYPRGLRADQIVQEARIVAVADVVEAMATFRPYRPALGLPVALAEIEAESGVLYDRAVVEACLVLFREKHFELPLAESMP